MFNILKTMSSFFCICLLAAFLIPGKAKAETGAKLFKKLTCISCHGKEGRGKVRRKDRKDPKTGKFKYRKGDPMRGFEEYPKLAGQNPLYLYIQMKDIFSGKRTNGKTKAMYGIRRMIEKQATDADLKAIAEYLSKVKPLP